MTKTKKYRRFWQEAGLTLILSLFLTVLYSSGCSSYHSLHTSPYGSMSQSSRGVYGPISIGSDTTSAGDLAGCLRDREAQAARITEAQQQQLQAFGQQFWAVMPPSWQNPASMTDDHLLCLMLVSGADPGYAVSLARDSGSFYGGGFSPMSYVGAPGVR